MKFNFDEVVDRTNNYAAKLEEMSIHYGSRDIIPLWIADMDFKTAPAIVDSIKERADQGIFGYTWRTPKYFESINNWQKKRNNYEFNIENMAFAPGVVPAMRLTLLMFSKDTDKILTQQPVYHPFADVVENTNRTLLVNPLKRDEKGYYTMDLEDFEEKAKQGVKYFILDTVKTMKKLAKESSYEDIETFFKVLSKYHQIISNYKKHKDNEDN